MISFTANIINRPKIRMFSNGKVAETKAAFMELDPSGIGDNIALENLVEHWGSDDTYVRVIEDNFKYNKHNPALKTTERFFVLAEPKRDGRFLDVRKILGIAQTSAKGPANAVEIDYFQIIPKHLTRDQKYGRGNLGIVLMNSLKKFFGKKDLWLYSTNEAKDFYLKNGFAQIGVSEVGLPIMKFFVK